jgi:hypothetical protein
LDFYDQTLNKYNPDLDLGKIDCEWQEIGYERAGFPKFQEF